MCADFEDVCIVVFEWLGVCGKKLMVVCVLFGMGLFKSASHCCIGNLRSITLQQYSAIY